MDGADFWSWTQWVVPAKLSILPKVSSAHHKPVFLLLTIEK